jgi:hypothetical protein
MDSDIFFLQILMIRLQRVTFLALHDYLGLTTELTRTHIDIPQVPTTRRTHNSQHHHHKTNPTQSTAPITTSTDTLNNPEDNFFDDEQLQKVRLFHSNSNQSCTSVLSDISETTTTTTPETKPTKSDLENPVVERPKGDSIKIPKRSAIFAGQRSKSVVESSHMKVDFEEAAARARVKNSLDTTFFEKHKISYPNISNKRASDATAARRRSSFSDVRIFLCFFISFVFFLSLTMQILIQNPQAQTVIVVEVNIMNVLIIQIFKQNGRKFENLSQKHLVGY